MTAHRGDDVRRPGRVVRPARAVYTPYGKQGSGSATVEATLTVAGVPFRDAETASWERNAAYAELPAINPLGQIPTMVLPYGSATSERAAIPIHLGEVHAASALLPAIQEHARAGKSSPTCFQRDPGWAVRS